jgi:xylan 1,4-beta-xylosidase
VSKLTFFCDLAEATTPLPHFWEHTVGSDHARMALRDDWRRQFKRAHDELGFRHVRFHGLLPDDVNPTQIFDYLLSIGMKPFVELSFMPDVLASGSKTVFSYKANVTPPRDYKQWATLIERFVSQAPGHSIETEDLYVRLDNDGSISLKVSLPAHADAAITIDFKPRRTSR